MQTPKENTMQGILLRLIIVSFLLAAARTETDKAAQRLLNSYDLDEIVEKLLEFDLDQDGQLTEMEVELQQPGIQKYLDKYAELLKAAEEEEDEEEEEEDHKAEEPKKAQETEQNEEAKAKGKEKSQPKSNSNADANKHTENVHKEKETVPPNPSSRDGAYEDEDDGVEIEVVDEMEIVEDEGPGDVSDIILPVVVAGVVVAVTIVAYALFTVAKSSRQAKLQQQEEFRSCVKVEVAILGPPS